MVIMFCSSKCWMICFLTMRSRISQVQFLFRSPAKSLPAHYAVYLLLPVLLWAVLAYDVSALWTARAAIRDTRTLLKHAAVLLGIEMLVRAVEGGVCWKRRKGGRKERMRAIHP